MKNVFKFLVFTLVFAFATSSFANDKKIIVGTNATYPPFEFLDNNSNITGFDIELIKELSKKIGFEYEIQNMNFDGLIPALKSGKIDLIIAAMSSTPQRLKAIDFTEPYYTTENIYIKNAGSVLENKIDLEGKKIAVQLGTIQEQAARNIKDATVVPMKDIFSAVMALENKKVDVVLVDSSIGYGYLKTHKDLEKLLTEPDGSNGFSIAFDKDKQKDLIEKINKALDEFKKNGTFDKILQKYDLK